jgi:hypothetical protein
MEGPTNNYFLKKKEENPEKYPERMGEPWTNEEDTLLLKRISKGYTYSIIAEKHYRTPGSISARLRHIARVQHQSGKSVDEIHTLTQLSKDEIELTIKRSENAIRLKEEAKKKNLVKAVINTSLDTVVESKEKQDELLTVCKEIRDLLKELLAKS